MQGLFDKMSVRRFLLVLATALALLWPAFVNGGPFWFPDTSTYIRSADAATLVATGSVSEWSDRMQLGNAGPVATQATATRLAENRGELRPTRQILTGRSIYYGFLIYLPMRLFGPWGAIVLQALITAGLLVFCGAVALRGAQREQHAWAVAGLAALVLLTPLPFYVGMLMPDVYSGLLVLAMATLVLFWSRLSRAERAALVLACGAMASFHTTHLLLALVMTTFAVVLGLLSRIGWRPVLACVPIATIAVLANALFSIAVEQSLHRKPISPPFLSARLTADGIGTDYLKQACSTDPQRWELCRYAAKLPLDSDKFLWSENPRTGVFQFANNAGQMRLASQDKSFALAVLRNDPAAVIGSSIRSALEQMVSFDLVNFNYPTDRVDRFSDKYPPAIARAIAETRAAQNAMPTRFTLIATIVTVIASLAAIGWMLWRMASHQSLWRNPYTLYVGLLLLAVVANAVICGGLSGAHARYQIRLVWLLPFAALFLAALRSEEPDTSLAEG